MAGDGDRTFTSGFAFGAGPLGGEVGFFTSRSLGPDGYVNIGIYATWTYSNQFWAAASVFQSKSIAEFTRDDVQTVFGAFSDMTSVSLGFTAGSQTGMTSLGFEYGQEGGVIMNAFPPFINPAGPAIGRTNTSIDGGAQEGWNYFVGGRVGFLPLSAGSHNTGTLNIPLGRIPNQYPPTVDSRYGLPLGWPASNRQNLGGVDTAFVAGWRT